MLTMLGVQAAALRLSACMALVTLPLAKSMAAEPEGGTAHLKRTVETPETVSRQFLAQNELDLKADETYTLTFWAKSPQGLSLKITGKMSKPPWAAVGKPQIVDITSDWQKYEVSLTAEGALPEHTRVAFSFGSPSPGDIWIADVRLRDSAAAETVNLLANGKFEDGLAKWYFEGQRPGEFQIKAETLAEANGSPAEAKN